MGQNLLSGYKRDAVGLIWFEIHEEGGVQGMKWVRLSRCVCLVVFMIIFLSIAHNVLAISNELKAKSNLMQAQLLFENQEYAEAIPYILDYKILVKESNSDAQYILSSCYYETKKFSEAKKELEIFFDITNEMNYDRDKFNKMVQLITLISDGIQGKGTSSVSSRHNIDTANSAPSSQAGGGKDAHAVGVGPKRSVQEALTSGIQVDDHFVFKKGMKIVLHITYSGFETRQEPGLLFSEDVRTSVREDFTDSIEFLFLKPDGETIKYREEHTDNLKPGSSFVVEKVRAASNFDLRMSEIFPVSTLKPGVTWLKKRGSPYGGPSVEMRYRVEGFETVDGFDCVVVKGEGKANRDNFSSYAQSFEEYKYDYNNGGYVFHKIRFLYSDGENMLADVTWETKRISMSNY